MASDRPDVGLPEAWRLLRRQVERLYGILAAPVEAGVGARRPGWREDLQDVERFLHAADEAVRGLEARQALLDEEWDRAQAEKWRLHGVWSRLRDQLGREGAAGTAAAPDQAAARDVAEQSTLLELLWSEIGRQEAAASREKRALTAAWRRLLRDLSPRAKEGAPGGELLERLNRLDALLRVPPEVEQLSAEARRAHEALLASRKEIARLERLRRGLEARLSASVSENDQLRARAADGKRLLAEAAGSLAGLQQRVARARDREKDLEARLREALLSLEAARGRGAGLSEAVDRVGAERDGLRRGVESLREELHRLTAALAAATGDRDALRETLEAAEDRFRRDAASLRDSLAAATEEAARFSRDLIVARAERDALCEGLAAAEDSRRQEAREAAASLGEARADAARRAGERDAARRDLEAAREALAAAERRIADLTRDVARAEGERDAVYQELSSLDERHGRRLELAREEVEAARAEAARLSAALAMSERRGAAARREIEEAGAEHRRWLRSNAQALQAAEEETARLSAALAMARREREAALQERASEEDAHRSRLREAEEGHERRLTLEEETLEAARGEISRLAAALAMSRREGEAAREELEAGGAAHRRWLRSIAQALQAAEEEIARLSAALAMTRRESQTALGRPDSAEDAAGKKLAELRAEAARKAQEALGWGRDAPAPPPKAGEAPAAAEPGGRAPRPTSGGELEGGGAAEPGGRAPRPTSGGELEGGGAAVPIPRLEPELEPPWAKVLELLRQPLASAYAQLRSLASAPGPEGPRVIAKLAAGAVAQAQDVLRALTEYLQEPSEAPSPQRLQGAADAALAPWDSAFRRAGISVVRRFDDPPGPVPIHSASVRVAFYQVIRNAYEAMPSGGCLTVRCWRDPAAGQACLSFADTGPGFAAASSGRLFEPMAAGKPGRPGIGLALARRIVRRLGGDASAENGPQGGAVVTLRFPLSAGGPLLIE